MSVMVSLTGGLGNQLFQLSAGLYYSENSKLHLISSLGAPRLANDGLPEIMSFELPDKVIPSKALKANLLLRKITGFLLFNGISDSVRFNFKIIDSIIKRIGIGMLSIKFRIPFSVLVSRDVGFYEITPRFRNFLLVGYFQSFRWAENDEVKLKMMAIHPKVKSKELETLRKLSIEEKPLIVHIRLTDYLAHPHFGTMNTDYYRKAIEYVRNLAEVQSIWVFSDSIEDARDLFPSEISCKVRWISDVDGSTSQTFEAMRFGSSYIIANSTFSWWAAYLRYNQESPVICPKRWFKEEKEPREIIPQSWTRVNAKLENDGFMQ